MGQTDWREQLRALGREIEELEIDDQERQTLRELLDRLEQQVERGDEPDSTRGETRAQLEARVARLELEYPRLAGVLRNVLTSLSSMGI